MKEEESIREEREKIEKVLGERLEAHDKSRRATQNRLEEICKGLEASIDGIENKVSGDIDEKSTAESNRLQSALDDLQADSGDTLKAAQRAKAELLVMQTYDVVKPNAKEGRPSLDGSPLYELKTERKVVAEVAETLRPTDVRVSKTGKGTISLQFTCLDPDVLKALSECGIENPIRYKCLLAKKGEKGGREYVLEAGSTYEFRVKPVLVGKDSEWNDETEASEEGAEVSGVEPAFYENS